MNRRTLVLVGILGGGAAGLMGQGHAMERLSRNCFGHTWDSGASCCQPGVLVVETGIGDGIRCVAEDGNNLPGQPPGQPPTGDPLPGGGGGGGGGGGRDREPPECQADQRPFPPQGRIVGLDIKAGEIREVTEDTLKLPGVQVIPYTAEEIEAFEQEIDTYMAKKDAQPKPACKETCRSCRKTRTANHARRERALSDCSLKYTKLAHQHCEYGHWRNDPRRGDTCGLIDQATDPYCGDDPGDPVREFDCHFIRNPRTNETEQVCETTGWWDQCMRSWMRDIPDRQITNSGATWSVPIGPITVNSGQETVTVTITGGKGFESACAQANMELFKKVEKIYDDCVARVEAAHPGVTCP